MKPIRISKHILQLDYESQEEMAYAFMRVEDHWGDAPWNGGVFTVGQYRAWYTAKHGAWTYPTSFQGICISIDGFDDHFSGLFDPLLPEEYELVEAIRHITLRPVAIIGTFCGGYLVRDGKLDPVLEHEVAHALFQTDPEYRKAARVQAKRSGLEYVRGYLKEKGYHTSDLDDEVQAYLIGSNRYLDERGIVYPEDIREKLVSLRDAALTKAQE